MNEYINLSLDNIDEDVVTIDNIDTWTSSQLKPYIGQTIQFTNPMYVTNNYSQNLPISPRRMKLTKPLPKTS